MRIPCAPDLFDAALGVRKPLSRLEGRVAGWGRHLQSGAMPAMMLLKTKERRFDGQRKSTLGTTIYPELGGDAFAAARLNEWSR